MRKIQCVVFISAKGIIVGVYFFLRLCEPLEWNEKDIMTFFNSLRIDYTHAVQSHHIGMNTDSDAAYIDMNTMCNVMTDESIHCPVSKSMLGHIEADFSCST